MSLLGITARITSRRMVTTEPCRYELHAADGGPLPAFTSGVQINVRTPRGEVRSYSLTDDTGEPDHYAITVTATARAGRVNEPRCTGRCASATRTSAALPHPLTSATPLPGRVHGARRRSRRRRRGGGSAWRVPGAESRCFPPGMPVQI